MSATGRGAERNEHDLYETPAWAVRRFLEAWKIPAGRKWLEPACGNGAIVHAVNTFMHMRPTGESAVSWTLCDIDPRPFDQTVLNVRRMNYIVGYGCAEVRDPQFDCVISNPPYTDADRFVKQALTQADHVAMLLRLNWLSGDDRSCWMRANTPDVYVLPNRPDFTGEGGDATDYAWLVWNRGSRRDPRLQILNTTPLHERKAT